MTVDIVSSKPRSIDFTFDGKPLFVRRLPLQLGLKMQAVKEDESLPAEIIAEIISQCVVGKNGKAVWSVEDVLGLDLEPMLKLFSEISGMSVGIGDAEKN